MAGYPGTPLPTKLGIKPSVRIALVGAPAGFRRTLGPLPEGVVESMEGEASLDLVLYFTKDRAELERRFSKLAARLDPAGALWAAWPERSSGVPTDLTESVVQGIGLAAGLVDNKVCALDEVWSALRFVVRLADRPKWPR